MSDSHHHQVGSLRASCALDFSVGAEPLADLGSPLTFGRSQGAASPSRHGGEKRKLMQAPPTTQKTIPEWADSQEDFSEEMRVVKATASAVVEKRNRIVAKKRNRHIKAMSKRFGEMLQEANADLDKQAEVCAARLKKTSAEGCRDMEAKWKEIEELKRNYEQELERKWNEYVALAESKKLLLQSQVEEQRDLEIAQTNKRVEKLSRDYSALVQATQAEVKQMEEASRRIPDGIQTMVAAILMDGEP